MKYIIKSIFFISFIFLLNGCDAQTLNDINSALNNYNNTSYGQSYNTGTSGAVGFKTGETISGFNKICYYNKLGSVYTLNIPSTSLCPLTIR